MNKGHLRVTSLSNLKNIQEDVYYRKLFIVRSAKPELIENLKSHGVIHVPQLSPSLGLYGDYMNRWKHGIFTNEEKELMELSNHSWFDIYTERFNEEMITRIDMINSLNRTEELLNEGKNVLYICYCADYSTCHRSLLAEYFIYKHYEVILE